MVDDRTATLLTLLNSTPVVNGEPTELLADDSLRAGRDLLQAVVRGEQPPSALAPLLENVVSRPSITDEGVEWRIEADPARRVLVDAVLAWDEVHRTKPGRLRACANDECALFLLDRSKANNARWCSMGSCGNRLKARRHYERSRTS